MPKGRILAVDDQRYFRELIEGILTEDGFEVQTASSGDEALRILEHGAFDIVLTDLVMPVMTGTDLVQRVKELDPDQEIVVVTGVVDVKSAVDAMKLGATDYILKPFDRGALCAAIESILQRGRLRVERDRLLAENIEYLGERSLFERAIALFGCLSVESLAAKLLEGLCHETGCQGGVLWIVGGEQGGAYELCAARGLVRVEEERKWLPLSEVPEALREGGLATEVCRSDDALGFPRPALWVALRRAAELVGVIRLTDKLGGEEFDDLDHAAAKKLMQFAESAFHNAERFTSLERSSLQDPVTGAYHIQYLEDVARNEIEKANRFGRAFGLIELQVGPLDALRQKLGEAGLQRWRAGLTTFVGRLLRATDLLAVDGEGGFRALLAETDAIGAATFKRRTRHAIIGSEWIQGVAEERRPEVRLAFATYPGDATQLESLTRVLQARIALDRGATARDVQLDGKPLGECLQHLLSMGDPEPTETVSSLVRFALAEVGRRPRDRNLFFFHPGAVFGRAVGECLSLRRGPCGTDVVVAGEPPDPALAESDVVWVSAERLPGCPPFAIHFGDGPPYALVCADKPEPEGVRLFHTGDRSLVEYLAFRLQRELKVPRLS
jgi:two-component system cell cycle response regulator